MYNIDLLEGTPWQICLYEHGFLEFDKHQDNFNSHFMLDLSRAKFSWKPRQTLAKRAARLAIQEAENTGYTKGYQQGREIGLQEGWKACVKQIDANIKKHMAERRVKECRQLDLNFESNSEQETK